MQMQMCNEAYVWSCSLTKCVNKTENVSTSVCPQLFAEIFPAVVCESPAHCDMGDN